MSTAELKFTCANTTVEIDFPDQFIDNRSKGGTFGGGTSLRKLPAIRNKMMVDSL